LADLAETRQKLQQVTALYNQRQRETDQPKSVDIVSNPKQQPVNVEGPNGNGELVASNKKWSFTVLDESGNQSNSLNVTDQDREREAKLKQYYLEKYAQLESQLHMADSKAVDLFARKEKLEQLYQQTKEERDALQEQLQNLKSATFQSVDALESTKINYEQQQQVLSDHVIELREKMTRYQEEIDTIKKFKVRCGKCKTWNTVEWLMTEGKNGRYCSKGNHPSSLNYA